jgi:hypothetical protein
MIDNREKNDKKVTITNNKPTCEIFHWQVFTKVRQANQPKEIPNKKKRQKK